MLFSGGVLAEFLSLGSLCNRGSKVLGYTDSRLRAIFREVFSLPSVFLLCDEEVINGVSYLLSRGISFI